MIYSSVVTIFEQKQTQLKNIVTIYMFTLVRQISCRFCALQFQVTKSTFAIFLRQMQVCVHGTSKVNYNGLIINSLSELPAWRGKAG